MAISSSIQLAKGLPSQALEVCCPVPASLIWLPGILDPHDDICTRNILLGSAIDPIRAFQSCATFDLISKGRVEMVVFRSSFIQIFPLFGHDLNDYDLLFNIRDNTHVHWSGECRPSLTGQGMFPRP